MHSRTIDPHRIGTDAQRAHYLLSIFARSGNAGLVLALIATAFAAAILGRM